MSDVEQNVFNMLKILEGKTVKEGFLSLLSFNLVFIQQLLAGEPDMPDYVQDWLIESYSDLAKTVENLVHKSKENLH